AHSNLARSAATHAVRERNHVVVQEHQAMPRLTKRLVLRELAQERELPGADRSVVAEEATLRARAGVEADEDRVGFRHPLPPGPALVHVEADPRGEGEPGGALRLGRRARTAAPAERKEVEIVVARNGEEPPLVDPAPEGGLDELPARAVVGDVARENDGVDGRFLEGRDGSQEP